VESSLQREMLLVTYFVNVKVNGVLKPIQTVKIRGFDTFLKCKSRGGGYRVSHGRTLKMSSSTLLYGGYINSPWLKSASELYR
jgi:hypothetical protein